MKYYTAIRRNASESVLMRWIKLEPVIQSEVSHKEKHKYYILTHIYMEFRKTVNDDPICKAAKKPQKSGADFWIMWEKARVG